MSRARKAVVLGGIIGLAGALFGLSAIGTAFERNTGLAWLFHVRGPLPPPAGVAVVAIDSGTGSRLGLPEQPRDWPRSVHARLVDELVRRGASAIVFDMYFNRPKRPQDDQAFARSIARADNVVLFERLTARRQPLGKARGDAAGFVWIEALEPPLPLLASAAKGLGPFPLPKIDANVYGFWAFRESAGGRAATLPAVALQVHALGAWREWQSLVRAVGGTTQNGLPPGVEEPRDAEQLRERMRALRHRFSDNPDAASELLDYIRKQPASGHERERRRLLEALAGLYTGDAQRYLNFYGPPGTIRTIPYHAVLPGESPDNTTGTPDLHNTAVFVGLADLYNADQPDRFYTVFTGDDGVDLSGVEIAATAFANLLTGRTLKRPSPLALALVLFGFGLFAGVLAYRLPAGIGVALTLGTAATWALFAQWAFDNDDYWLPLATPLLGQLPAALLCGLLLQYRLERRRSLHVSEAIRNYLPEQVVRELTEHRVDPASVDKVVDSTCLATDMSGFSGIAERLAPGELALLLNDYFDTLAEPLRRHHVDVTEFRADAIMCAWTSAQPDPETRREAILAALEARNAIESFRQRQRMPDVRLRIGLETGPVYIGHAGGGGHFVYSIVGDCANTASRIEGLNRYLGTEILATQAVAQDVDDLLVRPLGLFQFVGKRDALPIVEICGMRDHAAPEQLSLGERFAEALGHYQSAQWDEAAKALERILGDHPGDGPSRFYLARCRQYLNGAEPPADVRVIRMQSK